MIRPTVFLCYARKDRRFARRLEVDLANHGVDVFKDDSSIRVGESLRERIEDGLDSADYVVYVLSPVSVTRPWVNREVSAALNIELRRRRDVLLPVLIGNAKIPTLLRDKRYADFRVSHRKGLSELLAAVLPDGPGQLESVRNIVDVDLVRLDGTRAVLNKRQLVRCTRGIVTKYVERLSAAGQIDRLRVGPGAVGSIREEGNHLYVEHLFPTALRTGQRLWRYTQCVGLDSFLEPEDHWELRHDHPTDKAVLTIRFPRGRPPISWWAYRRQGVERVDVSSAIRRLTVRGKPALRLTQNRPSQSSASVLWWRW